MIGVVLGAIALGLAVAGRLLSGRHARAAVREQGVLVDGGTNSDELYHLAYTGAIRAQGHKIPRQFPNFVGPGRITYPGGFHWVLSFLPARALPAVARYGGLVGDLVLAGAISALLVQYVHMPIGAALILAGLYLISPALTLVNIGPRSFHLTPRLPSQLLYGAVVAIIIAEQGRPSPVALAAVVVLLAAMLLTSKFSLQVLVFSTPVLMISGAPLDTLGCAVGACLLAVVVSRGFFVRQVAGQLEHLEWYVKRQRQHMVRTLSWRDLAHMLSERDIRGAIEVILVKNPLTAGLIRHIHVIALGAWLIAAQPALSAAQKSALAFTVAGCVGWIATSCGALRVLGESERYLEFALPATWFLFWSLPHGAALAIAIALAAIYELALYAGNLSLLIRRRPELIEVRRNLSEVLERLRAEGGGTVLFLTVTDTFAVHGYESVRAVMYSGSPSVRGETGQFFDWFFVRYPLVNPRHLQAVIDRYGADAVIERRDRPSRRAPGARSNHYDLRSFRLLFSNASYSLYSVPDRQFAEGQVEPESLTAVGIVPQPIIDPERRRRAHEIADRDQEMQ